MREREKKKRERVLFQCCKGEVAWQGVLMNGKLTGRGDRVKGGAGTLKGGVRGFKGEKGDVYREREAVWRRGGLYRGKGRG